jgi:hypothetical protein
MAGILKFITSLVFSKFLEESISKFVSRIISQSSYAGVNKLNQKYANAINNVEVKVKNYIFVVGLLLMAVFLLIIGILSILLTLIFYLFNSPQIANPFLVFGAILVITGCIIITYSKKLLNSVSTKNFKNKD